MSTKFPQLVTNYFPQSSTSRNPHRATRIGEMYYTYDGNGNVIRISNKPGDGQNSSNSNSDTFSPPFDTGANTGWAGVAYGREPGGSGGNEQSNQYKWDEENRLIHARVNGSEIDFLYNAGGERTAKQGKDGEVIYYDKMYQVKTNVSPLHITKHIFLGSTRVVSKLSHELGPIDLEYEKRNAYYYHGDHLGSSNYLTDYEGNEYEHYEYTPFGEMWVEEESDSLDKITFKFTSKELDEETGLYYFGARYLDAKTSRWLSCDPVLGDYLPQPAISDEAKKYNKNLPGMGGVFNPVNLSLYHYAGNNPLKYTDPTGEWVHIVVGAVVGGVISAGISVASQKISGEEVDLKKTAIAFAAGSASGALAATGVGLVAAILGNGAINGVADLSTQLVENGGDLSKIDFFQLGASIALGLISGTFGGAGADQSATLRSMGRQLTKRITGALQHKSGNALRKELVNAFVYYLKSSKTTIKRELLKSLLRGNIPIIAAEAKSVVEKNKIISQMADEILKKGSEVD